MELKKTYWVQLALLFELAVSTVTAEVSAEKPTVCYIYTFNTYGIISTTPANQQGGIDLPFGVEFEQVVPFMAFIRASKTHTCCLSTLWCAGVAGVQGLPLHIALGRSHIHRHC